MAKTKVEIDAELMHRSTGATGQSTNQATVEPALDLLVEIKGQERIREAFRNLPWDDGLNAMRLDRAAEYPAGD